jgi:histidine phosphotransferase ChpT
VVKVVLNMVLIASECLPKGGVVGVNFADQDDGLGVVVTAAGEGARLVDDMIPALSEGVGPEDLSARNVHAHYAQSMARDIGATVAHAENASGEIQLVVLFPDATGC